MKLTQKFKDFTEYLKTTRLYEISILVKRTCTKHPFIPFSILILSFCFGIILAPHIGEKKNYDPGSATINSTSNDLSQKIYVTVNGEVLNPGMYELTTDDRINDAILKAGGFTENAYIENLNLAQLLSDGQYINVMSSEEFYAISQNSSKQDEPSGFYGIVNINTATVEELCQLPGIGESTALKIIEYRDLTGGFENIEDIQNVSGIGPSKYEKIKYNITV